MQEISVQQLMTHLGAVKKDMVILEKSEFSQLRNETEVNGLFIMLLSLRDVICIGITSSPTSDRVFP